MMMAGWRTVQVSVNSPARDTLLALTKDERAREKDVAVEQSTVLLGQEDGRRIVRQDGERR